MLFEAPIPDRKKCSVCKAVKNRSEFYARKDAKDGLRQDCRECFSKSRKKYYQENREAVKSRVRRYVSANRDVVRARKRAAYHADIDKHRAQKREDFQKHKEKRIKGKLEYFKRRRKSDPMFALSERLRARLHSALKSKGYSKTGDTQKILGCDWSTLVAHLEAQFSPGMSWDNRSEWHIDHIVPLSSAKTEQELLALCHYTNLQPLWAEDNMRKGAKVPDGASL